MRVAVTVIGAGVVSFAEAVAALPGWVSLSGVASAGRENDAYRSAAPETAAMARPYRRRVIFGPSE